MLSSNAPIRFTHGTVCTTLHTTPEPAGPGVVLAFLPRPLIPRRRRLHQLARYAAHARVGWWTLLVVVAAAGSLRLTSFAMSLPAHRTGSRDSPRLHTRPIPLTLRVHPGPRPGPVPGPSRAPSRPGTPCP